MDIEQIWQQFGQRLRRFISARVPDTHVADELSQELLVKSYQNLDSLKDRDRVDAWLFRIARNVINDYYRNKANSSSMEQTEIEQLVDSLAEVSPHSEVQEELGRCIRPFVEQLPDKYRRTVTAIDLEGHSQKERAESLGVSHSTIKSQTQRGRAQLRQLFRRCCDFTIDARGHVIDYEPKDRACTCDCDGPPCP